MLIHAAHLVLASIVASTTFDSTSKFSANRASANVASLALTQFQNKEHSHDAAGAVLLQEGRGTVRRAPLAVRWIVRGYNARREAPGPSGKAPAGRSSLSTNKMIRSIKPVCLPLSLAGCLSKQSETAPKANQQIVPTPETDLQGPRAPQGQQWDHSRNYSEEKARWLHESVDKTVQVRTTIRYASFLLFTTSPVP